MLQKYTFDYTSDMPHEFKCYFNEMPNVNEGPLKYWENYPQHSLLAKLGQALFNNYNYVCSARLFS